MNTAYYQGNRERLYAMMQPGSLLMLFSGEEVRKTNDEYYPFFADRSFVYFTGLKCRQAVLLALKDAEGSVAERLYLLPPDAIAERWTGTRIKPQEAESVSGVEDVRFVGFIAKANGLPIPEPKTWQMITAEVKAEERTQYKGVGPVLYVTKLEPCEPPEEEVVTFNQ